MLPDHDEPGIRHAKIVLDQLRRRASLSPGYRQAGDVSDWLAAGSTEALLDRPPPAGLDSILPVLTLPKRQDGRECTVRPCSGRSSRGPASAVETRPQGTLHRHAGRPEWMRSRGTVQDGAESRAPSLSTVQARCKDGAGTVQDGAGTVQDGAEVVHRHGHGAGTVRDGCTVQDGAEES